MRSKNVFDTLNQRQQAAVRAIAANGGVAVRDIDGWHASATRLHGATIRALFQRDVFLGGGVGGRPTGGKLKLRAAIRRAATETE